MIKPGRIVNTLAVMAATILGAAAWAQAPEPGAAEPHPLHQGQPRGALTGASIFLSPGHGWYWTDTKWTTQRGNSHGIVEDFSNGEIAMQYTLRYLWNAGARVYTTRERDMNTNMVIIDEGDPGWDAIGNWEEEQAPGAYGRSYVKVKSVTGEPDAGVRFTPDIPEAGYYAVYLWYRDALAGETTTDARVTINHSGGSTLWVQNQNHDGYTWKYAGHYYFEKGYDPWTGSVTIENNSDTPDKWVIADAVRFGGGMGDSIRGGAPSGRPRWEESGRYYAEFMGYDPALDTRTFNTVSAMPMWAEWEMEPWEKGRSVWVSCHTNASGNAKSRGLFSFVYGPNPWDPLTSFTGYPGGVELCNAVHDEIINVVHDAYDPEWRDGAKITRWLGETNPRNNSVMPMALFEFGFHDNVEDAAYILDPVFRDACARGVYRGLVKFYSTRMDGFSNPTFLPEKPTSLRVASTSTGVKLMWDAPPHATDAASTLGDAATGYRVYTSYNGKGFDNGTPVDAPGFQLAEAPTTATLFVRVTATNAGGESFPTETLAVRAPEAGNPQVLIVNGFDRLDRGLNIKRPDGVERGFLDRMNTFDYSIQHAKALEAAGLTFDSTSNEAVIAGKTPLAHYDMVVWILGQENGGSTFDEAERALVARYLGDGGSLFVSGSEIAADMAEADGFLGDILRTELSRDDVGTNSVIGAPDSVFAGVPLFFFDRGEGGVYPVQTPDELKPANGAIAALTYGSRGVAAVQYDGNYRLIYLGFPFETIKAQRARDEIMRRAAEFLLREQHLAANATTEPPPG